MTTLFEVAATDVALTTDEWYTPRWLFKAAGITFGMDVCAPVDPAFRTCPALEYLTVIEDGLTAEWRGIVWMNPPYSKSRPWVTRWSTYPDGLALLPAAASPYRGWLTSASDGIALLTIGHKKILPGFGRPDGTQAGLPLALILAARGSICVDALSRIAAVEPDACGAWFRAGHVRSV